jgi:hypothetical protein
MYAVDDNNNSETRSNKSRYAQFILFIKFYFSNFLVKKHEYFNRQPFLCVLVLFFLLFSYDLFYSRKAKKNRCLFLHKRTGIAKKNNVNGSASHNSNYKFFFSNRKREFQHNKKHYKQYTFFSTDEQHLLFFSESTTENTKLFSIPLCSVVSPGKPLF